jgi:hypothetical protein
MNIWNKKNILLIIFINTLLSISANGSLDNRNRQSFGSVQLKIVNLTNDPIKFYLSRLYAPIEIKSQEEYITEKTLVSHPLIPLQVEVPSFIGIQYNNDENIIVYRFKYGSFERIFSSNNQYIVVVKDSNINFIEGNIDGTYDYFDESLYIDSYPYEKDWYREKIGINTVELKIENNSGSNRLVYIDTAYGVIGEIGRISIEDGTSELYTIDDRIFSLGGMRVIVIENGWATDNILLTNWRHRNNETSIFNYQPTNIKLRLNKNGYEISYY